MKEAEMSKPEAVVDEAHTDDIDEEAEPQDNGISRFFKLALATLDDNLATKKLARNAARRVLGTAELSGAVPVKK